MSDKQPYKRPSVDEDLYYLMAESAARQKMTVKEWLSTAIKEKLEKEGLNE